LADSRKFRGKIDFFLRIKWYTLSYFYFIFSPLIKDGAVDKVLVYSKALGTFGSWTPNVKIIKFVVGFFRNRFRSSDRKEYCDTGHFELFSNRDNNAEV
jgi:hypothetical protein